MDEGDAQFRAHESEMLSAKRCAIIDVEAFWNASAADALLEHGQKRRDVLAESKRRVRHEPRRIVDEREQVRFALTA